MFINIRSEDEVMLAFCEVTASVSEATAGSDLRT